MNNRRAVSILSLLILACGVNAASVQASVPSYMEMSIGDDPFPNPKAMFKVDGTPDYKSYYRDFIGSSVSQFFMLNVRGDKEIAKYKNKSAREVVMGLCWLAKVSGDNRYLDQAHDIFEIFLDYANDNREVYEDCFGYPGGLQAALMLKAAGKFDNKWEPTLRKFTQDGLSFLSKRSWQSDGNQSLARMYGCVLAKKLYPDMEEAISAAAKVNKSFISILEQGDLYTDSSNYFGVSLTYFILIAHELGQEQELAKSPNFKRMFLNFSAVISPNGYLPSWGSGYFGPNHYNYTPLYLEYSASLYQESSFSAAAQRNYAQLIKSGPAREKNFQAAYHGMHSLDLLLLDLIGPLGKQSESPDFISGITKRNAFSGRDLPGFLILRPSIDAGAPMIMMDLLSQGDHCAPELSASIAYYESNCVPLFYQYGRYLSGSSRGNQIIFGDQGASEPDPEWKSNIWHTVCIPSDRFTDSEGKTRIDGINLRTGGGGKKLGDSGFILDNMRLFGPAGTMPVCDLAAGKWYGSTHSITEGRIPGSKAIKMIVDGEGLGMRNFKSIDFDPKQYTSLLCDVQWFGRTRHQAQLRLGINTSHTNVETTTLLSLLDGAQVDQQGDDCHARIEYSAYGTFDSKLVRQIVLTREGVIAIRDDIMPGASAEGCPAFSLWQMYSIDDQAANRFSSLGECAFVSRNFDDSKKYRRGMSVYFSGPTDMKIGKQVIPGVTDRIPGTGPIRRNSDLLTAYSTVMMRGGQPTYLNTLVVPHPESQDFAKLDAITSTTHSAENSSFITTCDGKSVRVKICKNSQWLVVR